MFWKFSFRQPCAIDALLEKEDCTLDEILDEDDVLQECKSNNKKLTDFLARPEILERLVRLICFEAEEDAQDKVKFKYPHLACELLTSEVFRIVEQLSTNDHLLGMLWHFLESPDPINPLLASFISKVLAMLLSKEANVIVSYIKAKEDFISKFLNHLGTSAIMDLLIQMVAAPTTDTVRMDLALWLKDNGIVTRLVDFIKDQPDQLDSEQCANSSLTLCEMIRISRESYQLSTPTPLHEVLESKETITRLLGNMFSVESPSDAVIINGVSVLLAFLRDSVPMLESGIIPITPDQPQPPDIPPSPGINNVLEVIVPSLKDFHTLLTRKPEVVKMLTTVGMLEPPLGNMRLQVVKLISALLVRSSSSIEQEVVVLGMFNTLISLFFAFPWNNFLHMQVELCIKSVLESSLKSEGSNDQLGEKEQEKKEGEESMQDKDLSQNDKESLKVHLLKDCQLVSNLLDGVSANESEECSRRQGYMGHLVRISNSLVKFGEKDEQLKLSLDEDTHQRWNNFVNGPLAEMNKKNETNLGGNQPLTSNMDDSEDEFDQLPPAGDSELEKAYQQYLDVKYAGTHLEEYGVEDELSASEEPFEASFTRLMDITRIITANEEQSQTTSSMFEAVCSDRIQQFDDEDSDDDDEEDDDDSSTWVDKDINLSSPMDHHSASSDEDEFCSRQEFPTGESHGDIHSHKLSRKQEDLRNKQVRASAYLRNSPNIITQITSTTATSNDPDKMEIENSFGVISWKSGFSTADDLSGVIPMDTGSNLSDWTKEPDSTHHNKRSLQSPGTGWADFTKFSHAFGTSGIRSTQSIDEPSVTPSHITVTYITRDMQNASNDDGDFLEPSERPDPSKYSVLSPDDKQRRDLDPDTINMTFEESNVRCSDSDDDDLNSSDSDDERSGNYSLNISQGSEREELINSLNDSREQDIIASPPSLLSTTAISSQAPSSPSSSFSSSSSSASLEHDHHPSLTSPNGKQQADDLTSPDDDSAALSLSNRHKMVDSSGVSEDQKVPGEVLEDDLKENYIFLSKQGMLSDRKEEDSSQSLLQQKRAEALDARVNYDKEVKATLEQDS